MHILKTAMLFQNRHRILIRPSIATIRRRGLALALAAFAFSQVRTAYAQNVTDTDIANYARAVVEIEAARQATYEEASNILAAADSEISLLDTQLSCSATRISDMPDIPRPDKVDLQRTLIDFCNQAAEIADAHALTPSDFNRITAAHQIDSELSERIQAEIAGLES